MGIYRCPAHVAGEDPGFPEGGGGGGVRVLSKTGP